MEVAGRGWPHKIRWRRNDDDDNDTTVSSGQEGRVSIAIDYDMDSIFDLFDGCGGE
jgi:hypothetical protein